MTTEFNMDTDKTHFRFRTHNINGFNNSKEFLYNECSTGSFDILAVQEHWLKPSYRKHLGTNSIKTLHPMYDSYATSGMESNVGNCVLKGRPYGGTGFLFHKSLSKCLRARTDLKHERVTILELNTKNENILLISAYMPYFKTDGDKEQLVEYRNVLAFIENVMEMNPLYKFILFMDFNCNLYNASHPYSSLVNSMIDTFDLAPNYSFIQGFDKNCNYTRFDTKRNSYTLIDGILISKSLSHTIQSSSILHPPDNVSDHLPVEITIALDISDFLEEKSHVTNFIPWASLTSEELNCFRSSMLSELCKIDVPYTALNHNNVLCNDCDCLILLEKFHDNIVTAIAVADSTLPRKKHGIAKPYWSPELTALKQKSIDAHNLWKNCNCPRTGPIFSEKVRSNYEYKKLLRQSKSTRSSSMTSELSNNLFNKDSLSFWKTWKSLNGQSQSFSSMIDGCINHKDIANRFAHVYEDVYKNSPANDNLRNKFNHDYPLYCQNHMNDPIRPYLFSWSDMLDALFKLKIGKSTSTFIKAEHLFHGCPELACYLHLLYNGLLVHSYMPREFLLGNITPIVKDSNGDITSSSNYRPITLGPILLQLFEYLLMNKFGEYLRTDDLQFGYKSRLSASHAIYVLRECVNYFTTHGSNVLVTFLDCSKAFDKVSHFGIFLKLMEKGVPLCFLNLIIYWYSNMMVRVLWRQAQSDYFHVLTGTKQGGVLSPKIFTLYVDELFRRLRKQGVGCHIIEMFLACLLYADDMCLIAPSRGAMQKMLDVCIAFCEEFCLSFNTKKSKVLIFGDMKGKTIAPLLLDNTPLEFVPEWTYLGATIVSGASLAFSCKKELSNFYRSFNSLLSSIQKPNELVLMNLLYSNCVPVLTHAAEVKIITSREMHECNVALNNSIRRIFSFNRWESIRQLRQQFSFPNITEIFCTRSTRFISKCLIGATLNDVVHRLADFTKLENVED